MDLIETARAQGLVLRPDTLQMDESGADFQVGHATDQAGTRWILRVPRRPEVRERAALEAAALALLRERLPVRVPEWRVVTDELIAYPRLAGEPAATINPDAGGYLFRFEASEPPITFIKSLGATLATLHAIDPEEVAEAGLPVHSAEEVREAARKRVQRATEALEVPAALLTRWQRWLDDDRCWPTHTVPVHGDLHPPHILLDEAQRVTGLLDWTEMAVDDPAVDFVLQYASMGESTLDALLNSYARAGGELRPHMRRHVVESWCAYPARVVTFADITGKEEHLAFAQFLVDHALEIPEA